MGISLAGSAGRSLKTVAREGEMVNEEDNELILEAVRDFQRGCQKIERAIEEGPLGYPDTIEFLETRIKEVRALCDFMLPPKPCWPANVVPFVPRRTG